MKRSKAKRSYLKECQLCGKMDGKYFCIKCGKRACGGCINRTTGLCRHCDNRHL